MRQVVDEETLEALEPWAIYQIPCDRLPTSPGRTFLPSAVAALAATSRRLHRPAGIRHDAGSAGPQRDFDEGLHSTAARVAALLREGGLTCHARPIGGRGSITLDREHWDHDREIDAVATGAMPIVDGRGVVTPHWLFVVDAELQAAAEIIEFAEAPLGPYIGPAYQLHERTRLLSDLLLSSIAAVASLRATRHAPAPTPQPAQPSVASLSAMLSSARLELTPAHRDAVETLAATWLEEEFGREGGTRLAKETYRLRVIAEFGDVAGGRMFGRIWDKATKDAPERRKAGRIPD